MAELRDLEADRRLLLGVATPYRYEVFAIAIAALNEIDRLKRILVWKGIGGSWTGMISPCQISGDYPTEADAWAAVRKAAMK